MDINLSLPERGEEIAYNASLHYVNGSLPGISRKKCENGFVYYHPDGTSIVNPAVLKRIASLAIPPAYRDVWICPFANGHIQATGRDSRNRKQYRYHPLWQKARQMNKFMSMLPFGRALSLIREHIHTELVRPAKINKNQIICAIIYLLDRHLVRIGNAVYEKQNQSFGITTLRKKHLSISSNEAILEFEGKNSKLWHIVLKDKKIIRILKKCEEIPGYKLFKYADVNGGIKARINGAGFDPLIAAEASKIGHDLRASMRAWL
jgi:DNA topoisomerase-1